MRPLGSCIGLGGLTLLHQVMDPKEKFIKNLGRNIRSIRIQRKLTVEELALEAGIPYSQISRVELGKRNPTAYTLHLISKSLDCCPSEFFKELKNK
jgi:transcriptional regulator with XRE-family HTH domain